MSEPSPSSLRATDRRLNPAMTLLRLWQQGQAPVVETFLAEIGPLPLPELLAVLRVDYPWRWRRGERVAIEDYQSRFPSLASDPEAILDLVYQEILLREAAGESPGLDEYLRRFPSLAEQLRQQFEVHQALLSGVFSQSLRAQSSSIPSLGGRHDPLAAWVTTGGYQVIRQLGQGGMGVVYQAYDEKRDQIVALKTMKQATATALYRFKQEFRVLADVIHPNLVALYELISNGPVWFYTMEFVDGVNFLEHVRSATALPFDRLRSALGQLAEGLIALHRAGRLHRDVKPSNVLVDARGRVVLLDFGLAMELQPGATGDSEALAGTVAYMAPEQAAQRPLTPASDWYSVGAMLYEALAGRLPFQGRSAQVLKDKQAIDPPPPRSFQPGIPEDLETLCLALLQRVPERRPAGDDILRGLGWTVADEIQADPQAPVVAAPSFVGRQRQLEELHEAFRSARERRTTLVYVQGKSGFGKSALVSRFLDELTSRPDTAVLSGRCYERESVPYKLLDSLIDALSRHLGSLTATEVEQLLPEDLGSLTRLFPVLGRVAAPPKGRAPPGHGADQQELRRRAFAALRELLTRLGQRTHLVLHIDDLQWGDADSALLLMDLLRPPDPPRLCLLCAYRSEHEATSPCLQALLKLRQQTGEALEHRELTVGPLTEGEAQELAENLLRPGLTGPEQCAVIARESGGSPYLIRELAAYVRSGEVLPQTAGERFTLDDVLWQRVLRLTPAAQRLLEVVAISGRPLRQHDAYRAAGLELADRAALTSLRAGNLVRSMGSGTEDVVEPYHDRIRESVAARLPVVEAQDVHRRLAETLEAAGQADPETLADHFHGAGLLAQSGYYYHQAGDQAARALAFEGAARLYQLALELHSPGPTEDRAVRSKLAAALANAGRGREAAEQYERLTAGAGAIERIDLEQRAAYQFCTSGHLDEGRAMLHTVLGRVGMKLPVSQWRALLSLFFHRICLRLRGLKFRPRAVAEVPPLELARVDVSWSVGAGLGTKNIIVAPAFQARNVLLALAAGEPTRIVRALAWEAAQAANEGRSAVPRIRRLLKVARSHADRLNDPYAHGMVALASGVADFHAGRWKQGVEAQERAVRLFRQCTGVSWELGQAHTFLLWCLSWMGEWAEMTRRSDQVLREARDKGDLFTAANIGTYMEPLARLAEDRPEEAHQAIAHSLEQWSREEYNIQHFTALMSSTYVDLYRSDAAASYQRHLEQRAAMARALILQAQICRVVVQELRARSALGVAAASSQPAPMLAEARQCVRRLEREKLPFGNALGTLHRAGIAALEGDRPAAVQHLIAAVAAFDRLHMALWAAAARWRLGEMLDAGKGRGVTQSALACLQRQQITEPARLVGAFVPWSAG